MSKKILFYCPKMETLAKSIVEKDPSIILGKINWGKFEDGWSNIFIENCENVIFSHVYFLANFDNPFEQVEQLNCIRAFPCYRAKSLSVFLPFFPTATMERVSKEGQIATARSLARDLSSIPFCHRGGPAQIFYLDEHFEGLRFYFTDGKVIPVPLSSIPLFFKQIKEMGVGNISIALPDNGAYKRFASKLEGYPIIICDKIRDGEERIITIKEGNPKGRNVVLLDDLVRSGRTLKESQAVFMQEGALTVNAFVPHAAFNPGAWNKFLPSGEVFNPVNDFAKFWITDTCPTISNEINGMGPFEVVSICDTILKEIQR